jgi:hypothetical protein
MTRGTDMIYREQDIFLRIKATLPGRWFGEETPVLDSILHSMSAGWMDLFNLLHYVSMQSRISSAFERWLDLIAQDYFGHRVWRRLLEADDSFRQRIKTELLRDRCTRAAIYDVLLELTGRSPIIFEPANPEDTGCYGSLDSNGIGSAGYCTSGGWGNLNLPFQAFVRAFRPTPTRVAMINGWGGSVGAFGVGLSAYISSGANSSWADNPEIYDAIAGTAPVGTIIWISIEP